MSADIRLAVQQEFPNSRLFPQHCGLLYTRDGTPIKIGTPGIPDIFGFVGPLVLFIEVKTGNAVLGKEQKKFQEMCKKIGAMHIVGRSPESVVFEIKKCI